MKTKQKKGLINVMLSIIIMLLITSCHSKYINLEIRTDGTIAWSNDSSAFAFIARTRLYRSPTGIAKFPDGGTTKNEYLDFSIYHFDIKHNKLTRLARLNEFYKGSAYRWLSISQVLLSLNDTTLYFKLREPYDNDLKYIDAEERPEFLNKIAKTYKVNITTLKKEVVDTTNTNLFSKKRERFRVSSAKKYLSKLKYKDWGIELEKMYPQSKNIYTDMIIEKQGNKNIYECIFQQIAPDFSEKDKNHIIDEMIKREKVLLKHWITLDREKDPYNRHTRKGTYTNYIKYMEEVKKKLNIPYTIDKVAEQQNVLKSLQTYGIKIPDDFKIKDLFVYGQGYDVEFELTNIDSVNIEKYKKWFRNRIIYLLNHKWESISKATRYGKPDGNGIITHDMINFIWENTELHYADDTYQYYLEIGISYNKNNKKTNSFTFSVSEEHIQIK